MPHAFSHCRATASDVHRLRLRETTWLLLAGAVVVVCANTITNADEPPGLTGLMRIEVHPTAIVLSSSRAQQQLVVTGHFVGGEVRDVTHLAAFRSDDPTIVDVEQARAMPLADGAATVEVRVGERTVNLPAAISNRRLPDPVQLRSEVLPVLTKQGCNAGSCHGSPEGKAGFSLSLMAYAPQMDEESLIRGGLGRRIQLNQPEESLLLKKPLLRLSHVGGKRLRKEELPYRLLLDWIAEGANADPPGAPLCTSIEVVPGPSRVLHLPEARQQLSVQARFSDGAVRDVTPLATYDVSNKDLLSCDAAGLVRGQRRGVAAVSVRYLSHVQSIDFTVVENVDGFRWSDPPESGAIDRLVDAKLRQLQYLPSEPCDDATFLRRVCLDLTGLLPSAELARSFPNEAAANKRAKLIDELLAGDEFARFWALKDADLMRVSNVAMKEGRAELFSHWLYDSWRNNQPYDQFVRDILTAAGDTTKNGPANYFFAIPNNEELAETTAQLFMGSRINCAKCHNHPFEKWTQDDYYRIAAVFVRTKNVKGEIVVNKAGEAMNPATGTAMRPWGSDEATPGEPPASDRRQAFSRWLTEAGNPFFARVAANRLWAHLLGRGIVSPVDDFRSSNPPSNPELLDWLADEFVQSGYDRRQVIRLICNSRTYQRSAAANKFNADEATQFSHCVPRRLSAEQLHDAVGYATRTLRPASTVAAELPEKRREAEEVLQSLPAERAGWEAGIGEKLAAQACWQGDWRRAGPFPNKTFDEAAVAVHAPETAPDFSFTQSYEGGKLKWQKHAEWEDGKIHLTLEGAAGPYYLARKIYAARPGKAVLSFGFNGSAKVWLNGVVLFDKPERRGVKLGDEPVEANLVAGENQLLFKTANGGGFFSFCYLLGSFDGQPLAKLDVPTEIAELVAVPADSRTDEQRQELDALHQSSHERLAALRDRVERLSHWFDYQTQRPYPEQSEFLQAFGQPKRESACACERSSEPTIDQALQFLNGELVRNRTAAGAESYARIADDKQLVEEMYLATLARLPSTKELYVAGGYLKQRDDRQTAVQDLLWALLNTQEFMFQH